MLRKIIYTILVLSLFHCTVEKKGEKGKQGEKGESGKGIGELSPEDVAKLSEKLGLSKEKLGIMSEREKEESIQFYDKMTEYDSINSFSKEAEIFFGEIKTIWDALKSELTPFIQLSRNADQNSQIIPYAKKASLGLQEAYAKSRQLLARKDMFVAVLKKFPNKIIAKITDPEEKKKTQEEYNTLMNKMNNVLNSATSQDITKREAVTLESLKQDYTTLVQAAKGSTPGLVFWGRDSNDQLFVAEKRLNTPELLKRAELHHASLEYAPGAKKAQAQGFFTP